MVLLRKQLELPPEVAKAFVRDMRAYFKAEGHKRDEIAARQRSALSQFQGPRDKKLRVTDVIKMFNEMKDTLGEQLAHQANAPSLPKRGQKALPKDDLFVS